MAKDPSFGERSSEKPHKVDGISKSVAFASVLLVAEALLVSLIIHFVPYTKIDWDAYMSQVTGFLDGERDYMNLKGDTGPLVYPAGFLYVYSAIKFVTAGQVFPAQILDFNLMALDGIIIVGIIATNYVCQAFSLSSQLTMSMIWIHFQGIFPILLLFFCKISDEILFGALYIVNLAVVLLIYQKTELPWWTLVLLCLSKRVHSIFMLRLFNDCVAMALLHAALALLLYQKWHSALILFSAAVSVKMNVLLFAPPLLLLMLKALSIKGILSTLSCAALIQILLGLPFLLSQPMSYISRAFNLGRVFIHFWSVNFKFVPEDIFTSKEFACSLLVIHLTLLLVFSHFKWCKNEGGLLNLMRSRVRDATSKLSNIHQFTSCKPRVHILHKQHIATVMFVGNFIGIICARSLHYQFYSWYFFSLPYLLWKTPFPTIIRMLLFAGVELCWNVYPSTTCSSLLLLFLHITILWGLWISPTEHTYVGEESHKKG